MKCPDCKDGDVIVKRTRTKKTFYGCSRYPDCKYASWVNPKLKKEETPVIEKTEENKTEVNP